MSILDGIKLLGSLSQNERENLSLYCQEKVLKAGEVLFNEGDEGNAMYILKSGEIEVSKEINGINAVLGPVNAEEILGEMAIFGASNKRMAKAVSVEECQLIVILSFSIKELTIKYPDLLEKIKDIINERNIDNKIIEESIKN